MPRTPLRRIGRSHVLGLVGCGVLAAVATGCVSQGVADQVDRRLNYGMSTAERTFAYDAALDRARTEGATVTARATVSEGTGAASGSTDAATPAPCTSGRLLDVILTGHFPHQERSGGERVSGQELTVDATDGRVCSAHYLTGSVPLDPESVLLFTN